MMIPLLRTSASSAVKLKMFSVDNLLIRVIPSLSEESFSGLSVHIRERSFACAQDDGNAVMVFNRALKMHKLPRRMRLRPAVAGRNTEESIRLIEPANQANPFALDGKPSRS